MSIATIITRLATIEAGITGIVTAFDQSPEAIDDAYLPAVVNQVGRGEWETSAWESLLTHDVKAHLFVAPRGADAGLGAIEALARPFVGAFRDTFAAALLLNELAGVRYAELVDFTYGVHTYGGRDYLGGTFTVRVTEDVSGATPVDIYPTVTAWTPTGSSEAVGTTVTATFDRDMASATLTTSTFTLTAGGVAVAGSVAYTGATRTATFTPAAALGYNTVYTATLTTSITSNQGRPLLSSTTWTFTTERSYALLAAHATAGVYYAPIGLNGTAPTWSTLNGGLTTADQAVRYLAKSDAHGDRAYLVTENYGQAGGNVWRNDNVDGGGTWTKLTLPAPTVDADGGTGYAWTDTKLQAAVVAADPSSANIVYVGVNYNNGSTTGSYGWLYRSLDAGGTWSVFTAVAAGQVRNLSISPVNTDLAYISFDWLARERIYQVNNVQTGNPPTLAALVNGAIQTTYVCATPALESWWVYGENGYRHESTALGTGTESYGPIGSLVVESTTRARTVTGNATSLFCKTDGVTQTATVNLPANVKQCLYGANGWYFAGGAAGVQVTADDGGTWADVTGTIAAGTVRFLKIIGLTALGD